MSETARRLKDSQVWGSWLNGGTTFEMKDNKVWEEWIDHSVWGLLRLRRLLDIQEERSHGHCGLDGEVRIGD